MEKAKEFLKANPKIMKEIQKRLLKIQRIETKTILKEGFLFSPNANLFVVKEASLLF